MLDLDSLESQASGPDQAPKIQGKWASIVVKPYRHTDDTFTLGIVFKQHRKNQLAYRVAEDLTAFNCLYGPAGAEQFKWLLEATVETLSREGAEANLGPHVRIGHWASAQGNSADEILDSCFAECVLISQRAEAVGLRAESAYGLSTSQIRAKFGSIFKRRTREYTADYWHPKGIVEIVNGKEETLDLPLWIRDSLFQPIMFGTVISMCYHDEAYRGFFLNGAFRDLSVMYDLCNAKGKGALFVLRPTNAPRGVLLEIDRSVDRVAQLLAQHGTIVEIRDKPAALVSRTLEFINGIAD